jgi:hypothetical protein
MESMLRTSHTACEESLLTWRLSAVRGFQRPRSNVKKEAKKSTVQAHLCLLHGKLRPGAVELDWMWQADFDYAQRRTTWITTNENCGFLMM